VAQSATDELRLPWTGEFSPGQLGDRALEETLAIVGEHAGNRVAIVDAIRERWFADAASSRADPAERLKQQLTRSGNVLNGAQNYGLVDKGYALTDLGTELLAETDDARRRERFAGHVLKSRHGLELLDVVRYLRERAIGINKATLAAELRRRGFQLTTNASEPGKMRQWLGTAGVIDDAWIIDDARVAEITGTSLGTIGEWQGLSKAARAFLGTIRRLAETRGTGPIPSAELLDFVREEHGPIFDEAQVSKVYRSLEKDGWVEHFVTRSGRGGKGGAIAATEKLLNVDFELLLGFRPGDLPADLRAVMTKPLDLIYEELQSDDTYIKGLALECLTVNLAIDLGLLPLRLRVRGVRTGGAEVDLLAEGTHLQFSRWLFQCKNTKSVGVGVLAKEVGMATLLQAHVVVIATTGTFTGTVVNYAQRVSETTPFQVVLADEEVLSAYRVGGAPELRSIFRRDAHATMQLKRPQVLETLEELTDDEA
jgi:hypothetical protein